MATTSILRTAAKSHRLIRTGHHQNEGLSSLLRRESPRRFSTEAEEPQQQPSQDTSSDGFLRTPNKGLFYGRLVGITKHTTKSDIVNLLEECKLSLDDIKVDYSRNYFPTGMVIQFPSGNAFTDAFRVITRKGRLYKLERADRSQWDLLAPYDGKAVLLQGLPRQALLDDIERFLSGCTYDASTIKFSRLGFSDPIRLAVVSFPSKTQAMHAFITKNRGFCLNNQILMRVLE